MAPKRPDNTDQVLPKEEVQLNDRMALRPDEAARTLGISKRTLSNWIRNEGLPVASVGRVLLIPVRRLFGWIEERTRDERHTDQLVDEILDDLE